MSHIKGYEIVEMDNIVYYIRDVVYDTAFASEFESEYDLLRISDYAVNNLSNTIIKCRQDVQALIENFLT